MIAGSSPPLGLLLGHCATQCHHGSHQIAQWPSEVVLGGHDHVVIHADVVDDDTEGWSVRHGDLDGASGEILPKSAVALLGGVHHAAVHGAVRLNSGRNDPHQPILPPA